MLCRHDETVRWLTVWQWQCVDWHYDIREIEANFQTKTSIEKTAQKDIFISSRSAGQKSSQNVTKPVEGIWRDFSHSPRSAGQKSSQNVIYQQPVWADWTRVNGGMIEGWHNWWGTAVLETCTCTLFHWCNLMFFIIDSLKRDETDTALYLYWAILHCVCAG